MRYGILVALTGDNAPLGGPWVEGSKLAVSQINAALKENGGSDGAEIVGVEDSQGQVASAIAGARKLVDIEKANAVIGDTASAPSIAVAQAVTIPKNVLQFTLGTSPAITELEDNGLFFRATVSDALQGPVMAQALGEQLGPNAKVNIAYHDDAYGQGLRDVFKESWEEAGGTIGTEVALSGKGTGYDTEAQKLVEGDPDGWMFVLFCSDWGKLRGPLLRGGVWSADKTIVADAAAYCEPPDTLQGDMGGVISNSEGDNYPAFEALYNEKVGDRVPLQDSGGIALDSVLLTYLAAYAAGSSDPAKVSEQMVAISGPPGKRITFENLAEGFKALDAGEEIDYDGVTSGIDFDDNGDIKANFFKRWKANPKGGFTPVGERFAAKN
jgi:branched-chain amino acid transport system substrate-binding protein